MADEAFFMSKKGAFVVVDVDTREIRFPISNCGHFSNKPRRV
jgi:hypothetical protein